MLVVDPLKRSSLQQVKRHRWMLIEAPVVQEETTVMEGATGFELEETVNEQILRLMQSLGVDPVKTKESVLHQRYDHHAAIYYLLLERRIHLATATSAEPQPQPPALTKPKRSLAETHVTAATTTTTTAAAIVSESPSGVVPPPSVASACRRPPLWTHSPPLRDSACGDSVDSERGSVGGSFLSPLMETAPAISSAKTVKSNTFSVDEGVEDWSESCQSPMGDCLHSSAGSAFETCLGGTSSTIEVRQQAADQQQQRLQGLELPALFHEGRRASDGLMCQQPMANQNPPAPRRPNAPEGGAATLLSETHREHKALCLQFNTDDQSKMQIQETAHLGQHDEQQQQQQQQQQQHHHHRARSVLRQTSYKLAQQQPVHLGTPLSASCHPIAEADPSLEVSPDHDPDDPKMTAMMMKTTSELDEWCRLPSSLAACDLNPLPPPS